MFVHIFKENLTRTLAKDLRTFSVKMILKWHVIVNPDRNWHKKQCLASPKNTLSLLFLSGEESSVAGEGGEGTAFAREPVGRAEEEVGGTTTEDRETKSSAGGETEAETGEE